MIQTLCLISILSAFSIVTCQVNLSFIGNAVQVSYVNRTTATDFIVVANISGSVDINNCWVGIGFNVAPKMDGTDVVTCINSKNQKGIVYRYNTGYNNALLDSNNPSLALSGSAISISNSSLVCLFKRENSNVNSKISNFNTQKVYMIVAYGNVDNAGQLAIHQNKASSPNVLSFSSSDTVATTTTSPSSASNGQYTSGSIDVKWFDVGQNTNFVVTLKTSSSTNGRQSTVNGYTSGYVAIGFSNDQLMGDDDVVSCIVNNGVGSVYHLFNKGRTPDLLDENNPTLGISNDSISFVDGSLICSFSRRKSTPGGSQSNYFDLSTRSYYLLVASGSVSGGNMNFHSYRAASLGLINFLNGGSYSGTSNIISASLKTHACLSVFAWMLFGSVGVYLARYFKFIFPSIRVRNHHRVWFLIHVPVMTFVPILSIIAFLVVLSQREWTWVPALPSTSVAFAHSIFGIIAIGLAFIQLLYSFCRPDMEHPRRFIFNWIHRVIGFIAFWSSVICIWLGVFVPKMNLGNGGWGVVLAFTLWIILAGVILEVVPFVFKEKANNESYEMNGNRVANADTAVRAKKGVIVLKWFMLVLHVIASLACSLALVILIGLA